MPQFRYLARDAGGRPARGEISSDSVQAAAQVLRGRGLRLLSIQPLAAPGIQWSSAARKVAPRFWLPPRPIDVELALRQIGIMLRSGLTLLGALQTVAEQTAVVRFQRVWADVADRIQRGDSLYEALAAHRCFPPLVLQLVRVGETTGTLDQVLDRAARALEQRRIVKMQIVTALAYPSIVLVAAIGVTVFMLVKVIPQLQKFLSALGRKLPAMTQALLDISAWIQVNAPGIIVGSFGLIAASYVIYRSPQGRLFVDRWLLRMPLIGPVLRLGATASFANALGILLQSGITLLDGLRAVEQLHRNRHLANVVGDAREQVLRGESLARSLPMRGAYMPMLNRMVAVGEEGGTLDEVLAEVATFHESQLQIAIRRLSALVEPAIIVFVGGIVGFVYISFFVALFAAGGAS